MSLWISSPTTLNQSIPNVKAWGFFLTPLLFSYMVLIKFARVGLFTSGNLVSREGKQAVLLGFLSDLWFFPVSALVFTGLLLEFWIFCAWKSEEASPPDASYSVCIPFDRSCHFRRNRWAVLSINIFDWCGKHHWFLRGAFLTGQIIFKLLTQCVLGFFFPCSHPACVGLMTSALRKTLALV